MRHRSIHAIVMGSYLKIVVCSVAACNFPDQVSMSEYDEEDT